MWIEVGCMGTVTEHNDCIDVELGVVDCVWVTGRDADIIVFMGLHGPRLQDNR